MAENNTERCETNPEQMRFARPALRRPAKAVEYGQSIDRLRKGTEVAGVTLRDVRKVYPGNVEAVRRSSMDVHDKEFMVMVSGPLME